MMHTAPRVQDVSADPVVSTAAGPYPRALMFVGNHDVISGAMAAAIERQFPCLSVNYAGVSLDGHRRSNRLVASGNV